MLLRFFRFNDPYRILGLLVILMLMGIPFLIDPVGVTSNELKSMVLGEAIREGKTMYVELYDNTPPLASVFFGCIDWFFGRSLLARHVLALVIIFLQASYFTFFLLSHRAYKESTYVPALIFGVMWFFSFDLISLSAELLGSTALMIVLFTLFKAIRFKIHKDENLLKASIWLGIATLFVSSYCIFFFAALLILGTFIRMTFREVILLLFGFLLPHVILVSLYYYYGNQDLLWQNFYMSHEVFSMNTLMSTRSLITLGSVSLVFFLFSFFVVFQKAKFVKRQQQLMQCMLLWLFFAALHMVFISEISPSDFVIFVPPFAYFISYGLLLIKRKGISEWVLWLFLVGQLGIGLLSRYDKISVVDYSLLFPRATPYANQIQNKRVLILGEEEGVYQHNVLGGFFLNWNVSSPLFEKPYTYEHLEKIAWCFEKDPPDIILDKEDKMYEIMKKIPALKSKYNKEGKLYKKY